MKAKITKTGCLQIERAGKWIDQYCSNHAQNMNCGDWCPKFFETAWPPSALDEEFLFEVSICNGTVHEVYEDERQKNEKMNKENKETG